MGDDFFILNIVGSACNNRRKKDTEKKPQMTPPLTTNWLHWDITFKAKRG
jgi:hypothetical protein